MVRGRLESVTVHSKVQGAFTAHRIALPDTQVAV